MRRRPSPERLVPWLVAAAVIGFVFWRVPIGEAWTAAQSARLDLFLPLVLAASILWFALESAAFAHLVSRVNTRLSWRESRTLRGVTYLLTPIHWNLGKAAIVLRLHRTKQVPLLEGASTLLLYQTLDAAILTTLALGGILLLPATPELTGFAPMALALLVALLAYLALVRADAPRLGPLERLRRSGVHHAHRSARRRELTIVVVLKTAYHLLFILVYYLGTRAFGAEPPLALVLAAAPIIQLIGSLPITPAGLGTQQAAMLYFFAGDFGGFDGGDAAAAIVAFGFAFPIVLVASRCLIGFLYLPDLRTRPERLTSTPLRRRIARSEL